MDSFLYDCCQTKKCLHKLQAETGHLKGAVELNFVAVRHRQQVCVPVRLVLRHIVVQSQYYSGVDTFCVGVGLCVVHGGADIIDPQYVTHCREEVQDEIRALSASSLDGIPWSAAQCSRKMRAAVVTFVWVAGIAFVGLV